MQPHLWGFYLLHFFIVYGISMQCCNMAPLILILLSLCCSGGDFHVFSLTDCICVAISENVQVKQAETLVNISNAAQHSSNNAYIPSLSVSNSNNLSQGRVLDPTTYQFVTNRTVYDMSTAIGGSMTLFSGFERPNNIEKAKLNLQSALLETEKTKNDIALNVTALFLNIVLDKEAVEICERKISMLEEQEKAVQKKLEYKVATPGDLLNIQADITKAKVELASAQNNLNLDKVSMCELLEIDDWESFDITTKDEGYETVEPRLWRISDIVSSAFQLPQIKQGELAIDIARRDVSIAKSLFWPTVSLNAGYGSTFSNARTKIGGEPYNFREQFRDNMSSYVTLSLNIPILSAITTSNNVKQKKLACTRVEYELTQAKLALDKEVKQAIVNANTSYEKYSLLETEVNKCREALRQTQAKYDAGAATYYDYQIAVGNLFQAEAQQLQSKYEYIFSIKIIDFYAGKSLTE